MHQCFQLDESDTMFAIMTLLYLTRYKLLT